MADIIGRTLTFDEVAEALAAGFAEELGVELYPDEVLAAELEAVERLVAEKYANEAWTARPGSRK